MKSTPQGAILPATTSDLAVELQLDFPDLNSNLQAKFRYRFDRLSRRLTLYTTICLVVVFGLMLLYSGAGYLPIWAIAFTLCVLGLFIMSIPRSIRLDSETLEIHCILELTRLHIEDVETIRRFGHSGFKKMIPLLGSYGFGGYYGYYFCFSDWSLYKVYAGERRKLVLIEDIYETRYLVSCNDPDELVALTTIARDKQREKIFLSTSQSKLRSGRSNIGSIEAAGPKSGSFTEIAGKTTRGRTSAKNASSVASLAAEVSDHTMTDSAHRATPKRPKASGSKDAAGAKKRAVVADNAAASNSTPPDNRATQISRAEDSTADAHRGEN